MCTEIILAFLYFFIIIVVNYFLYKILMNYFSKILYLIKMQTIFNTFKDFNNSIFLFLYKYSILDGNFPLKNFNKLSSTNDPVLIGNIYKYLSKILKEQKSLSLQKIYYFQLLKNQYLSDSF